MNVTDSLININSSNEILSHDLSRCVVFHSVPTRLFIRLSSRFSHLHPLQEVWVITVL